MAEQFTSGGFGLNAAEVTRRRAVQMIEMGQFETALTLANDAIKARPRDAQMLWVQGEALIGLGRLVEGAIKFRQCLGVHPEHVQALCSLAEVHRMLGETDKALELVGKARQISDEVRPITMTASIRADRGEYALAAEMLEPMVRADNPDTRLVVAYADLCIALKQPEVGIELLEAALARGELHTGVRSGALFILGRLLDRVGRYDEAFDAFQRANAMRTNNEEQRADGIFEQWSAQDIANAPRARVKTDRAVLIVGMPRSGTTLTESVIAAHPKAAGVGESQLLMNMRRGTSAADLTRASVDAMAKRYTEMLAREGSKTAKRVVDKMPDNYQNLGLAQCVLPECRVVWCQRDPRDICLSCYFQNFGARHAYTCDLEAIAQRYVLHTQLMDHWIKVTDLPVHILKYEELVADFETQVRALLDFLDLPFDEKCMAPHKATRQVSTASRDQVRQPVYASSTARWKRYEKHIAPMVKVLEAGGVL
jgi:tetratricopeptide (TPR) repeat protein